MNTENPDQTAGDNQRPDRNCGMGKPEGSNPGVWQRLLRWVVMGNPFYPSSAALVLLGVFLLSGEERMFGSELNQLYFNFGSVEIYGLLIATTAVYLFRRQIYYDTLMLVVLATLPLLVPFILISQAALLGNGIMTSLCLLAVVFGLGQCWVIRRGVFEIPVNGGMMGFVWAVLVLNLLMPIALKTLHAEANAIVWAIQLDQAGRWAWHIVIPMLVFGGFFVAQMDRRMFGDCAVGWLPLALMLLLVAGTAVHLWSLGYVYSYPFQTTHLYPVVWMAAWLVWWRRDEWAKDRRTTWARYSVLFPMGFGLLALISPANNTLFLLNLTNLLVGLALLLRSNKAVELRACSVGSLLGVLNSVPTVWLIKWLPNTSHAQLILLISSCLMLATSCFRPTVGWGIAASLSVIFPLSHLWLTGNDDWILVGQFALLTWWLHSLSWTISDRSARVLQTTGIVLWCLHSTIWFMGNGGDGRLGLTVFASVIAVSAGVAIWRRGGIRYWTFCGLALAVACLSGIGDALVVLRQIPQGLILMVSGIGLFLMGTLLAKGRKQILRKPEYSHHSFDGNNI